MKYEGSDAAQLANPGGVYPGWVNANGTYVPGEARGDPDDNDTYFFVVFNLNKKLRKSRSFTPRLR